MFEVGDPVRINVPGDPWSGHYGKIVRIATVSRGLEEVKQFYVQMQSWPAERASSSNAPFILYEHELLLNQLVIQEWP